MNQPIPPINILIKPTPKQDDAWELLHDYTSREIVFGGGAGGGKTRIGCMWTGSHAFQYPRTRWGVGRKELKRLKQTTLASLFDVFSEWRVLPEKHYKYNDNNSTIYCYNGSEILLLDLDYQPRDPKFERLGSLELTGMFIDEGGEVRQLAKEVLTSRVGRKMNKEYNIPPKLLITCNPTKNWLYSEFYKPSKTNELEPRRKFIVSLVTDNPHLTPEYIEQLKNIKDKQLRERLLNGNWEYDDTENALFDYDSLTDLFSNAVSEGEKYLTCDVARFGRDLTVIMLWVGLKVFKILSYEQTDTTFVEDKVRLLCHTYGIPLSHAVVDEDGIGGGVVDHLQCKGFVGNSSPVDPRKESEERQTGYEINYQNLRAQCYDLLANKVNSHEVAVVCEDTEQKERIIQELEQIKRKDADKDTKFRIIAKDEIKENIGHSPDYADCLMMRMYFEVNREKKKGRILSGNPLL